MRIGIYDPYLDDLGGGEKYMMSIASILSESHSVDVFWDSQETLDMLIKRFGFSLSRTQLVKNIFTPKVSFLQRFLQTRKYDIVIILSDGSIPLVCSKKLFLHIQQPLDKVQNNLWGKIKLSRVDKIFCNSNFTKGFVDILLQKKIEVIYPPVVIHAKATTKTNTILHVGRFRVKNIAIDDYKKQSIMIEAFKDMIANGLKNWKFLLAVSIMQKDVEMFEEMKHAAKGYPIEFLVNKTNNELWDLYSKASLYWHASGYGEDLQQHPEYAEHFGIATVEAMGAGCVPVVINAGGQKEIVTNEENGLLWNTLDELKSETLRLIHNKTLRAKLSENAKKRAKDFSYEKFSENIKKLLQ